MNPQMPPDPQQQDPLAALSGAPGAPPLEHEPEDDPLGEMPERPKHIQVVVTERERGRLRDRITQDYNGAKSDHQGRIARFRRYYRMWRSLNQTKGERNVGPALQVPLVKWTTFGQWAKYIQALLGEDAEVIAKPAAPTDAADAKKVGSYMTWRVFEYMMATVQIAAFVFRGCLFGRAHGEIIFEQEYYYERAHESQVDLDKLDEDGLDWYRVRGQPDMIDYEVLAYDGPRLKSLWPSQLILPAQDNVETVDDFEWKIRRNRLTPQDLLDGERRGKYAGVTDNWDAIAGAASQAQERDVWYDDEMFDADEAEGVEHTSSLGARDSVEVWQWYGKWRLPKGGRDVTPNNIKYRQAKQSELLVTYLPQCGLVIGIEDLRDMYPKMRKRSPFVDLSTVKDGSYWAPGAGELLEDLQNELSINHQQFRKAGMLSVGPVIFYKPNGEFDPDTFEYDAGTAVPTADPTSVKVVSFTANLQFSEIMQQTLKGIAELVTGVNDQTLGRSSDRPNAPQTASGQAMLLQEGNTRASLDMTMLREDFSRILSYVWALDREYANPETFFRVTGDDAPFDLNKGFGRMTSEEREHPYGFQLKFATSIWSREAKKQLMLQLYALSMQNPLVAQDPKALWTILNRVWESFGEHGFQDVIPEPPHPERPKMPKEEWALAMKGEVVHVNSTDDDDQHMIDHRRRLQGEMEEPDDRQDKQLQLIMKAHIVEHERQKIQKMMLQQLAARAMAAMNAGGIPSIAPPAMGPPIGADPNAPPGPAPTGVAPPPLAPAPEAPLPTGPIMPPNR